jgi:hypothetical protein
MRFFLRTSIIVGSLLLSTQHVYSQSTSVKVSIVATQGKSTYNASNEAEDYRWKVRYNNGSFASCLKVENKSPNIWLPLSSGYITSGRTEDLNSEITLWGEGWEEDGCKDDCDYNNTTAGCDDGGHCSNNIGDLIQGVESSQGAFKLYDYAPGINNTIRVNYCNGSYSLEFSVKYAPPTPTLTNTNTGQLCVDNQISLSSATSIKPSFTSYITYEWQYQISGETELVPNPDYKDCYTWCGCNSSDPSACYPCYYPCLMNNPEYISQPKWRSLTTVSSTSISFLPADMFTTAGITLTANRDVYFRVRAVAQDMSSDWSPSSTITFVPPPPKAGTISVLPSCPGDVGTGKVTVVGISSQFSTYRYVLKYGTVDALGCKPEANNCLSANDYSGSGSGSTLEISNVKSGTYTLFLLNNAGTQGFCPRKIGTLEITVIPNLGLSAFTYQDITCYNTNNGSVSATIFDGRPSNVQYNLLNLTTNDFYSTSTNTANASASLASLTPGSYRLTVTDGCTPDVVKLFDVYQPPIVTEEEFNVVGATCTDPGNGVIDVRVTRSTGDFDKSVSGFYHYQIFKPDGNLFDEQETDAASFSWSTLPPGNNYNLVVKEKGGLECNSYSKLFSILGPDPLGVASVIPSDVSCNGGDDGKITVTGSGGTGSYIFELSGNSTETNSTGVFDTLTAGDYVVTVKNSISCNDQYISPTITVNQPSKVVATITKKDISCYGLTDGEVTSVVSGGTVTTTGYSYVWETQINTLWVPLSVTTTSLSGLGEGDYRLLAADENNCPSVSNVVSILEPAILNIDSVDVDDIICFGEKGTIEVYPSGGITPYKYEYAFNGSSTYNVFTSTTALDAGTYVVRVKDKNNCSYQHADDLTITTPTEALDFTMVLSDFNGFNISCYGGSNGSATLTASGGNGADYLGYSYAVDANLFQADTKLENINAGDHSLRVKDDRGCVVSKLVNFTQTSGKLTPQLVQKKDVACFGDTDGLIEMSGTGGLSPFQYRIDDSALQSNGLFTGLGVGEYTITIIDKNNCDNNFTESIININPVIQIGSTIKDVNCFEGHDGTIDITINGGVSPFQYAWTGVSATTATVTDLKTGTYTVEVTDNAGCKMKSSMIVNQPDKALQMDFLALPVCYDRTDGSILIAASGGTSPYYYSIDDGATYQSEKLFPAVGVGSYKIKAKDENDCSTTGQAEVIQRNDKPEPNFLAATKRNALDTLLITEISVPKPDSIFWTFDPQATIISNDEWNPQIKFSEAGTYVVSMTGYFSGCDYSVTKELFVSPFDPNAISNPSVKPITSVVVTPNPSTGEFDVSILLNKKRNLSVVVYDMIGASHYTNSWENVQEVKQRITLNSVSSGIYLLRVITETDAADTRIVINK